LQEHHSQVNGALNNDSMNGTKVNEVVVANTLFVLMKAGADKLGLEKHYNKWRGCVTVTETELHVLFFITPTIQAILVESNGFPCFATHNKPICNPSTAKCVITLLLLLHRYWDFTIFNML
jgi:hypothetical protein